MKNDVEDYYKKVGFDFSKEPFHIAGDEFVTYYGNNFFRVELHSDTIPVLKKIRESGRSQSVLSAGKQDFLTDWIKNHNLSDYFIKILGIDNQYATGKKALGVAWMDEISYDSKENAGFHCGFLQLDKVPLEEGNPQSEYIFNNVSKTPDGENDWIPGPELRNSEEKGTAFIHGPDNSVIDKILSQIESELSSPQPITITIYNSSCLYEPDHIKLIERFPTWAYLYRKFITTESKNSLKKFETERRKQLQAFERIQKGIQDFTGAQSGWREVLEGLTLKLQREGIIKYLLEHPAYSNLKHYEKGDLNKYKKDIERMELADLEREAEDKKYEAALMVEDIKNGVTFFNNPEYMNAYSQIYTIESHLEKLNNELSQERLRLEHTDMKIRKINNNLATQKELEKLGPFVEHPEGRRVRRKKEHFGGKKKRKGKRKKNKKRTTKKRKTLKRRKTRKTRTKKKGKK